MLIYSTFIIYNFTQGCFVASLIKMPHGHWEEDSLISSLYFCYFANISSEERVWPFIWKEFPSSKYGLCQFRLKLAPLSWRTRRKCEKVIDIQMVTQAIDNGRSEKLIWTFSSGEVKKKGKHSYYIIYIKTLTTCIHVVNAS